MLSFEIDGKKVVQISEEEYLSLKEDSERLSFLEVWGVDNWGNYDDAMKEFWQEKENKEQKQRD